MCVHVCVFLTCLCPVLGRECASLASLVTSHHGRYGPISFCSSRTKISIITRSKKKPPLLISCLGTDSPPNHSTVNCDLFQWSQEHRCGITPTRVETKTLGLSLAFVSVPSYANEHFPEDWPLIHLSPAEEGNADCLNRYLIFPTRYF